MYYEVLRQMCFCYYLLYFIEKPILFLIVNFIRCHCGLMVIEEFAFHFYLSMPIDNAIAKMDSSQHTVLTNLIIFSYETAVNVYRKILKKNAYTN